MGASVTIADIYYKIQDQWQAVSVKPEWRLAFWIVPYGCVSIIDKFLEIERTIIGNCNDIFFRFDTVYTGDDNAFVQSLWDEYISWFTEEIPESLDILKALEKEGLMSCQYIPVSKDKVTISDLWSEMLRLKSCISGMENINFCVYFPPSLPEGPALTGWFASILKRGVPQGIRLVTIDYREKRKVKLSSSDEVAILEADFDMKAAINNEMDKECGTYNSTGFDSQYRKQIRKVMECTAKRDSHILDKEVCKLLSITENTECVSVQIATPLVAAQAYYCISDFDKSLLYTDDTIKRSSKIMDTDSVNGYPIWRVAIYLKAAIYAINKKREKAIEQYELAAKEATKRQDAFYIMESYRMSGHMMYELGRKDNAFERFLLSLLGGSYLDLRTRRESTFLYSAYMSLYLGEDVRSPKELESLEEQLELWLGDDWKKLLSSKELSKSSTRRKASIFS